MALRDLPVPVRPQTMAALAGFVRARLAEMTGSVGDALRREAGSATAALPAEQAVVSVARQFAVVVAGAAAPFAPTAYARARLLRQLHASGLLTDDEVRRTSRLVAAAQLPPDLLRDSDARIVDVDPVIDIEAADEPAANPLGR